MMSAWSPSAIWPIWVSSTVVFTMYESVPTTTIWALEALVPVLPVDALARAGRAAGAAGAAGAARRPCPCR